MLRLAVCPACRAVLLPPRSTTAKSLLHSASSTMLKMRPDRAKSGGGAIFNAPPSRRPPPPSLDKRGPQRNKWAKPPLLSRKPVAEADLTTAAIRDKILSALKPTRIATDKSFTTFGNNLGLDRERYLQLLADFARTVAREWHPRNEHHSRKAVEWDFDAIKRDCRQQGFSALETHLNRAFLVWVHNHVPLPRPTIDCVQPDPTLSKLHHLAALTDLRFRGEAFPEARQMHRKLILHVGPTNSGKTYNALLALSRARTGCYAGPLRLLAHEVFTRFNAGTIGDPKAGKRVCNLVTGEEQRILDPNGCLSSCTVEMFPLSRRLDVGVVDEIQMVGDAQRGMAWTQVLLGAQCSELHLCGEESVVDLVKDIARELGDEFEVKRYQRLSPLAVSQRSLGGDLSQIRAGDCFVTFSRTSIFHFKREIERITGLKVAVAYGALPPEVREEQARVFNAGGYDVLVASDAVGMGLNLKIRRIVFETLSKWDGKQDVQLSTPQIKQIAGRAGRFGVQSSPSAPDDADAVATTTSGEATTLDEDDMPLLRSALKEPVVQLEKAMLMPVFSSLTDLQALLPPNTRMSTLLGLLSDLARTSPRYQIGSWSGFYPVLDALHRVHPLAVLERALLFGQAPVSSRDKLVVAAVVSFATSFAAGERVPARSWANDVGLLSLLERVQKAQAIPALALPTSLTPNNLSGDRIGTRRMDKSARRIASSALDPEILPQLESSHRCLTLYLWLAYRNGDIFCTLDDARELRKEVESAIQFCLARTSYRRIKRRPKSESGRWEQESGFRATLNAFLTSSQSGQANHRQRTVE